MSPWILLAVACSGPTDGSPDSANDDGPPTDSDPPTPPASALVQFDGEAPTHLLIVTLDTTRRDSIGRYSGSADTPELDTWLDGAVVLDAHRSCSNWTGPAMTCFVSGRMPSASGFWPLGEDLNLPLQPPPDFETLATQLSEAGWDTRLLTANTTFGSNTGLDRGFDEVTEQHNMPGSVLTVQALDAVQEVLADPGTPWLVHVHYSDPHGPYCPPLEYLDTTGLPAFDGDICGDFDALRVQYWDQSDDWQAAYAAWVKAYYRAEIVAWDVAFGELIAGLDALGALDDTLIVFAADHGEQMGERNAWGHGILLGPEETRSVAAFWARDLPPVAWAGTTYHPDITATLHELYGLVPAEPIDGVVVGTAPVDRAVPIWNIGSGIRFSEYAEEWGGLAAAYLSVVKGDLQLDYDWLGNRSLYRLDTDPEATVNVYDATDPDVIGMWTTLSSAITDISSTFVEFEDPVDPAP